MALVAGLIIGAIKSLGDSGLNREAALDLFLIFGIGTFPVAFVLAVFLLGVSRFSMVTVGPDIITGRTFSGFKAEFPSSSVTEVKAWSNQGISYLRVVSDQSHRDITIVLLGVPISEYAPRLQEVLGTQHLLSKWFAENAA